jgi:transposase
VESERAKELYDQNWIMVRIAAEMGRKKSYVTKLVKHWFESRGLPFPDGRSRRSTLAQKHQEAPSFQAIGDDVKKLLDEGLLIQEIAQRLNCNKDTVTKAKAYWYTSHGFPVPDGRTRRKTLVHKVSHPRHCAGDDQGSVAASG